MAKNLFREELAGLKPYVAGKPISEVRAEYGLTRIEKLASNENPLGPSPKAVEAMAAALAEVHLYPEPTAPLLREALARRNGLTADQVVVGNGGEQLLQVIAQAFVNSGDEAVMVTPSFDIYASSVVAMGGRARQVPLTSNKIDLEGMHAAVGPRTKLVYLCSPNNPTGNIVPKAALERFAADLPADLVLVLDEAYFEYARANADYHDGVAILKRRPNTIVLRTFSKFAGLAGIRVAYLFTSAEFAAGLAKVRGTFPVNRVAQAGALAALDDEAHTKRVLELNAASMSRMTAWFERKGLEYIESSANFVFVNAGKDSMELFEALMRRGVIVRPGGLWGWKTWLRVSTGTLEQTQFFIESLEALLG